MVNQSQGLQQLVEAEYTRLRSLVPRDRETAILSIVGAVDASLPDAKPESGPDLIFGKQFLYPGGNKALQLCLETPGSDGQVHPMVDLDSWAQQFLADCGTLVELEQVVEHCQTGFMRMLDRENRQVDVWIASKQTPPDWRERIDTDWWSSLLESQIEPELLKITSRIANPELSRIDLDSSYTRMAELHVKRLDHQLGYPADAILDGCPVQIYKDVLAYLLALSFRACNTSPSTQAQSEVNLIAAIAESLAIDHDLISWSLSAFTLDARNVAFHASTPGIAAPVIRTGQDALVLSRYGLTTDPLFFLGREIRRRSAQEYHNASYFREVVFRNDLNAVFSDKRFVTSKSGIELRRTDGNLRTDVDAVVFDRKTGTLGVFELKSHDPFARSGAELNRRRDNVLYANRQISGILDWLNRHGADDLLRRVDAQTAKRFRVHKVFPFVLGRFLVQFNDGQEPDRRAAWGSWPGLLRLLQDKPIGHKDANPIASLFTRMVNGDSFPERREAPCSREIQVGDVRIVVHPSYAAFRASGAGEAETVRQRGC